MIVVDTNVISYALIEGPLTSLAREVRTADSQWRVPELWKHEYLNVLVTYCRSTGLDARIAVRLWDQAERVLSGSTTPVNSHLAIRLAIDKKLSGYDAQFVALATELRVPLVTGDRQLTAKCPGVAVSMKSFLGRT